MVINKAALHYIVIGGNWSNYNPETKTFQANCYLNERGYKVLCTMRLKQVEADGKMGDHVEVHVQAGL